MNILVTGSNGFVGSALMWKLQSEGNKVIGIDISSHCDSQVHSETKSGDIRCFDDLIKVDSSFQSRYKENIDLVIHCAASKHDFGISKQEYFSHNEHGTKVLLEYIDSKHIRRLVYFSTVSVFGHPQNHTDEDGEFAPDHPYGASKLAGELLCSVWQKSNPEHELVILRPTVIYGPHNYANMYKMIDMMHRRPWLTIGKGDYVKSIVSLANIIDMTLFAISKMKTGSLIFNCVDKPYITLRQLMEIIASKPCFSVPRISVPVWVAILIGKMFDIPARLLKIDLPINSDRMYKLATATDFASERIRAAGYIQQHSIEEEIDRMIEWYLTTRDKG